jgi:hypothetical protein
MLVVGAGPDGGAPAHRTVHQPRAHDDRDRDREPWIDQHAADEPTRVERRQRDEYRGDRVMAGPGVTGRTRSRTADRECLVILPSLISITATSA